VWCRVRRFIVELPHAAAVYMWDRGGEHRLTPRTQYPWQPVITRLPGMRAAAVVTDVQMGVSAANAVRLSSESSSCTGWRR